MPLLVNRSIVRLLTLYSLDASASEMKDSVAMGHIMTAVASLSSNVSGGGSYVGGSKPRSFRMRATEILIASVSSRY